MDLKPSFNLAHHLGWMGQQGVQSATNDFWLLAQNLATAGVIRKPAREIYEHFYHSLGTGPFAERIYQSPDYIVREVRSIAQAGPSTFAPVSQDQRQAFVKLSRESRGLGERQQEEPILKRSLNAGSDDGRVAKRPKLANATNQFPCEIDPECTKGPYQNAHSRESHYNTCHAELLSVLRGVKESQPTKRDLTTNEFACEIDPDCTYGPYKRADHRHNHYTTRHAELLAILCIGEVMEKTGKKGTGTLKCEIDENCPNGPWSSRGAREAHYKAKHPARQLGQQ